METAERQSPKHKTLQDIKDLRQDSDGAYYVLREEVEGWDFRLRIVREFREDDVKALHPQITASDGENKVLLALSKHHGWYLQTHNGAIGFNRKVLRYLNNGELSVNEDVFLTISGEKNIN